MNLLFILSFNIAFQTLLLALSVSNCLSIALNWELNVACLIQKSTLLSKRLLNSSTVTLIRSSSEQAINNSGSQVSPSPLFGLALLNIFPKFQLPNLHLRMMNNNQQLQG